MMVRRKTILWGVVFLGAVALIATWQYFALRRSQRNISAEPFETILKKSASDLVVVKRPDSSAMNPPRGYLVAYEQNPEGFKTDAKLFDTWLTAIQLASATLDHGPSGNWVESSTKIEYVGSRDRLDPWGHSLCLLRRGETVLIISGGSSAPSSPICNDIQMTAHDLATFPQKKLLQSPSGALVLVVEKSTLPTSQTAK